MNVLLTLNEGLGNDLGNNFTLSANTGTVTPATATKSELLAGKTVAVDNAASTITVTSVGLCTNAVTFNIIGITTTTTNPATTSTTTPAPTTTAAPTTTSTTAAPTTTSTTIAPTTTIPPIDITLTQTCDNTTPGSTYRGKVSVAITGGTGVYQLRAGYAPTLGAYVNVGTNPFVITSPTDPYNGVLGLRDTTGGSDEFVVQVIDNGVGSITKVTQIYCPTTTSTLPPITASMTSECFGDLQIITLGTFTGGNGTYYASDTTYATALEAQAGAVTLVSGASRVYNNQVSGTRYVYITSGSVNLTKSGGQVCTTTSTTTIPPTTTAAPTTTTLAPITFNMSYTCTNGLANVTINTFAGGHGGYSYGNTLFNYSTDAYNNTNWTVGTSNTYASQSFATSGDLWAIVKDDLGNKMAKKVTPDTTATWVLTGNTTCVITNNICANIPVYINNNQCSPTYGYYRINTTGTPQATAPSFALCDTTQVWTNSGSFDCYGTCNKYNVEVQSNPCAAGFQTTRQGSLVSSNSTFCGGCCGQSTSQVQGTQIGTYYTCSNGLVISTPVYQNSNTCYTGTAIYLVGGVWQSTNPSNNYPNTTATWVNYTTQCYGYDLYNVERDNNPCSPSYNTTRQGTLIEANSTSCGYLSPITYDMTATCTGSTQTITISNFSGGNGTYYANDTTYSDASSAASGSTSVVSGSRTYYNQPSGTRYVYMSSGYRNQVKQAGSDCTTTTTIPSTFKYRATECGTGIVTNYSSTDNGLDGLTIQTSNTCYSLAITTKGTPVGPLPKIIFIRANCDECTV